MSTWQPIESAPIEPFDKERWFERHSENLLLWNGSYVVIGAYNYTRAGKGKWHVDGRIARPTHWMPLPEPPK